MVEKDKYSKKIGVRLTDWYFEKLSDLSEKTGRNISHWTRYAIDNYLGKEAKDRGLI